MMDAMPRPRPPHLHREITRHGKTVWYMRRPGMKRVRLRAEYGTEQFAAEYRAAMEGLPTPPPGAPATHSLAWLIGQYKQSLAFARLASATRRQRELVLCRMIKTAGEQPYSKITRKTIIAGLDRRRETPFAAHTFLKTVRGLFKWAVDADYVKTDPTLNIEPPPRKTDGHHVWTEEEIGRFEARWPIGKRERLALAILIYTGLRRGDAARLGRQHVKEGIIRIRTEKNGMLVTLPMLPLLEEIIAATPTGDMTFIATSTGRGMTKESFGNWFRDACNGAQVPGSAHGLRKAAATRLANNGATVAQLEAIFGWTGGKMAALYTREADRTKLARDGMGKLTQVETRTSIPAHLQKVRAATEKE